MQKNTRFPLLLNMSAVQKHERHASLQLLGLHFKPFTSAEARFVTHMYLQYSTNPNVNAPPPLL